jgi:alpha-1,4-glucan:alpha-1,4-glucan 6-glycosyltransferase
MDKKLFGLMDWSKIEAVVYSEEEQPREVLGAQVTKQGLLIQTFLPEAVKVSVKILSTKDEFPMQLMDEAGFFAVLLPKKKMIQYVYVMEFKNGEKKEIMDPYVFDTQMTKEDMAKFNAGIHYTIYEKLGAHLVEIDGVKGVYFAVWAPNALRVSVVGGFNDWDGRIHQMERLWDSGVFDIFIPELKIGELYKFEIKAKSGLTFLKADPYANSGELRPNTASIITDISAFEWKDKEWLYRRRRFDTRRNPMNIYEVHIGSWIKPEGSEFYSYREIAPMLAEYVLDMHYTHIEIMPIMEYPYDASWGYQVTGYYSPTSRYGTPADFMFFVNYMHEKGIGVILDWVPAHFPKDTFALSGFDGTCLYEHADPRKGEHPHWGTLIYNYGCPEVKNFLIANALFWVEKYHIDGIRMDAVASMLYLDYGKEENEWVANMYGGNENLEAIEFLKHLNSIFKKRTDGALLIAEESTAWPNITRAVEEDGLGFDYKWNMGWMNDFMKYMEYEAIARSYHHGELTFSMIYAYSENFILSLSHDEVVHLKKSLFGKMPGKEQEKFANLRVAYGFMMTHPGKKLLFMGQEFAQREEWNEEKSIQWELLEEKSHKQMQDYTRALNKFYKDMPALYELDYDVEGFEWINNISANENIIIYVRKTQKVDDTLVVVCNFSGLEYDKYKIGVIGAGKYKELFNSDNVKFGGRGYVNPRVKVSKKEECDGKDNSITIKIPAFGICIFKYTKELDKISTNRRVKEQKEEEQVLKLKAKKSVKEEIIEKMHQAEERVMKKEKVPKKTTKGKDK